MAIENKKNIVAIFNQWFDNKIRDIHTVIPGEFQSYISSQRKAVVKPLVKLKTVNEKDISILPIDNVPVIFPSTKLFTFEFPIVKGDGCLLLFSESPIGNFLNSNIEQNSDDMNRFQLTDCIAIPGLWSFSNLPEAPTTKIEVDDSYNITIETIAGKIKIEPSGNITFNDGTEAFVKGTTQNAALIALGAAIAAIVPAGSSAANIAAIQAAFATFTATLPNQISQQIKGL